MFAQVMRWFITDCVYDCTVKVNFKYYKYIDNEKSSQHSNIILRPYSKCSG